MNNYYELRCFHCHQIHRRHRELHVCNRPSSMRKKANVMAKWKKKGSRHIRMILKTTGPLRFYPYWSERFKRRLLNSGATTVRAEQSPVLHRSGPSSRTPGEHLDFSSFKSSREHDVPKAIGWCHVVDARVYV